MAIPPEENMNKKVFIGNVEYRTGTDVENGDRTEWLVITLRRNEIEHQFDLLIETHLDDKNIDIRVKVKATIELAKRLGEDAWMSGLSPSDIRSVIEQAVEYFYAGQQRRNFLTSFYYDRAYVWLTASFGPPLDG